MLNPRQDALISALLSETTYQDAAKVAGIGIATVYRWMRDPEFQRAYRTARHGHLSKIVHRLQHACFKAVDTLVEKMGSEKDADAIRASLGVLDNAFRGMEAIDTADELLEIRQMIEDLKNGVKPDGSSDSATGTAEHVPVDDGEPVHEIPG